MTWIVNTKVSCLPCLILAELSSLYWIFGTENLELPLEEFSEITPDCSDVLCVISFLRISTNLNFDVKVFWVGTFSIAEELSDVLSLENESLKFLLILDWEFRFLFPFNESRLTFGDSEKIENVPIETKLQDANSYSGQDWKDILTKPTYRLNKLPTNTVNDLSIHVYFIKEVSMRYKNLYFAVQQKLFSLTL